MYAMCDDVCFLCSNSATGGDENQYSYYLTGGATIQRSIPVAPSTRQSAQPQPLPTPRLAGNGRLQLGRGATLATAQGGQTTDYAYPGGIPTVTNLQGALPVRTDQGTQVVYTPQQGEPAVFTYRQGEPTAHSGLGGLSLTANGLHTQFAGLAHEPGPFSPGPRAGFGGLTSQLFRSGNAGGYNVPIATFLVETDEDAPEKEEDSLPTQSAPTPSAIQFEFDDAASRESSTPSYTYAAGQSLPTESKSQVLAYSPNQVAFRATQARADAGQTVGVRVSDARPDFERTVDRHVSEARTNPRQSVGVRVSEARANRGQTLGVSVSEGRSNTGQTVGVSVSEGRSNTRQTAGVTAARADAGQTVGVRVSEARPDPSRVVGVRVSEPRRTTTTVRDGNDAEYQKRYRIRADIVGQRQDSAARRLPPAAITEEKTPSLVKLRRRLVKPSKATAEEQTLAQEIVRELKADAQEQADSIELVTISATSETTVSVTQPRVPTTQPTTTTAQPTTTTTQPTTTTTQPTTTTTQPTTTTTQPTTTTTQPTTTTTQPTTTTTQPTTTTTQPTTTTTQRNQTNNTAN
ncbi:PREDICTED: mucin-5AC-like [Priapulus caudatus]|uniref:Mucin-5AC-like n=1 Tax=Priapulus caudatus TaxID=37621 RepID=A0ABM1DY62_PRICU|nr:PREDICTED: mucin-5AC-like [Priapulus caudatus]